MPKKIERAIASGAWHCKACLAEEVSLIPAKRAAQIIGVSERWIRKLRADYKSGKIKCSNLPPADKASSPV